MLSPELRGPYYSVLCYFVIGDTRYINVSFILEEIPWHVSEVWTPQKIHRSGRSLNICSIYLPSEAHVSLPRLLDY